MWFKTVQQSVLTSKMSSVPVAVFALKPVPWMLSPFPERAKTCPWFMLQHWNVLNLYVAIRLHGPESYVTKDLIPFCMHSIKKHEEIL